MIEVKIVIPFYSPNYREKHLIEYVQDSVNELLQLNGKLEFKFERIGVLKPKIYLIDNNLEYGHQRQSIVFEIYVEDRLEYYDPELDDPVFDNEYKRSYFKNDVSEQLNDKIFNFFVLSQIAKPGSFKALQGKIYVDGIYRTESHSFLSIQRESFNDVINVKWPKFKNLSYLNVLEWFDQNSFSFERYSKNSCERALNAFSRLFKDNLSDIVIDLVWALVGIEALYCSSKEGIGEQIFLKTQILLGPITDFKSRIKAMYNFRFKLIHGSLDISPNNFFTEEEEDYKFNEVLFNSTSFAIAILTATFQEMVVLNKKELVFDLVLN